MTDDELSRVIHHLGIEFRPDSPYCRRLVLAGYQAALKEVWRRFLSRVGIQPTLEWIEEKQKEQP